jgi:hypothetical protein
MKSLEFIAKKFGKKLYSNKINLHVLTDKEIDISTVQKVFSTPKQTFFQKLKSKLGLTEKSKSSRDSLLQKDYHFIESKLLGIS